MMMTPGEMVYAAEAAEAALAELFERYPVYGSADKPWKLRGRAKVERARAEALRLAVSGQLHPLDPRAHTAPKRIARDCRIPLKQWQAIIGLIYG